ncbi:cell adhesion molecule CEACAM1-like [Glossophaga mutica]
MESPSAPARRGRVPCQGLLLAISLLTIRSPPTTAQLTVASINATEGKTVLLLVHGLPENLIGYIWYKGESGDSNHHIASYGIQTQKITPGPAHSSRETIYPNGSLLFQNITLKDTGHYTIHALKRDFQHEAATGQLCVVSQSNPFTLNVLYGPDTPSISPLDSHYPPGANHRLSCHTGSNPPAQYPWLISGRPRQPTQELFIPSITANDSGSYTCLTHNSDTRLNRTTLRTITVTAENDYTGYPVETIAGILIGVLILVALAMSLGYFRYRRRTERASDSRGLTEHRPSASTPGQGPSGTSTAPGPLPNTRTAGPIYEDLLHPSTDVYGCISPRADGAS